MSFAQITSIYSTIDHEQEVVYQLSIGPRITTLDDLKSSYFSLPHIWHVILILPQKLEKIEPHYL